MSGGLPVKKYVVKALQDYPVQTYIATGFGLWIIRKYQVRSAYNWNFGKFDFERQRIQGTL
jgi:hypothetical protein